MSDQLKKTLQLKDELETAQKKVERCKGVLEVQMKELEDMGVGSVEEGQEKLDKWRRKALRLKEALDRDRTQFKQKWKDQIRELENGQ